MRKTLGNVCYPRAQQVVDDPEAEKSRKVTLMKWRRKQLALTATSHVRRIMREDGLARSISELYDRNGSPPPDVTLEKMIRQYRKLKYQYGWLIGIRTSCREELRKINLVQFLKDTAQIEKDLLDRRAAREGSFIKAAETEHSDGDDDTDRRLPPKLSALIRDEIKRDIRRKEVRNARPRQHGDFHLSMNRRMQDIMQYLFLEYVPEDVAPKEAYDPVARYNFLFDALSEVEVLLEDLRSNLYDLEEYVESADLVLMSYE